MSNGTCGVCCSFINYELPVTDGFDLNVSNSVLTLILVATSSYLLWRLNRSYSLALFHVGSINDSSSPQVGGVVRDDADTAVLPVYYTFIQARCFWLLVACIVLFIPDGTMVRKVLSDVIFVGGAGFFDNWVTAALLVPRFLERRAHRIAFGIALAGSLPYLTMMVVFSVAPTIVCSWCSLFIPVPQITYIYIGYAVIYGSIALMAKVPAVLDSFGCVGVRLRPQVFSWALFLTCVYTCGGVGLLVIDASGLDLGFCVVNAAVVLYTVGYARMLYVTFVRDTLWLIRHAGESSLLLAGTRDMERGGEAAAKPVDVILREAGVPVVVPQDLQFGELLGSGAYGRVLVGRWQGSRVAVKQLHTVFKTHDESLAAFVSELRLLVTLRHPNIVLLLGASLHPGLTCIVMEYASNGSLFGALHTRKKEFSAAQTWGIVRGVVQGMTYLHARNIVHRDLKSPNVLLDSHWTAKLADFGLSRSQFQSATFSHVGTPHWLAPETLRSGQFGEKADVYSFGVVLWEIGAREPPYHGVDAIEVISRRLAGDLELVWPGRDGDGWRGHRHGTSVGEAGTSTAVAATGARGVPRTELVPLGLLFDAAIRNDPGDRPTFAEVAAELPDEGPVTA